MAEEELGDTVVRDQAGRDDEGAAQGAERISPEQGQDSGSGWGQQVGEVNGSLQ